MSGNTKDKIKKVALSLFAKNGYDATSMAQIAGAVGVRKSSLYAFISNKEALFWEVFTDIEACYNTHMEHLLADSDNMPAPERLYYLFKHYLEGATSYVTADTLEERAFWHRVLYFPPAAFKDKLIKRAVDNEMRLGDKYKDIIRDSIRQGLIRQDSPEAILLSYYSVRHGLAALMCVFMTDVTAEEKQNRIDKVWQNFWCGIKG